MSLFLLQDISLVLTLIGLCMTAIFHFSLTFSGYGLRRLQALHNNRRASLESRCSYRGFSESIDPDRQPITMRPSQMPVRRRKNFLKKPELYQNSMLYVFSRIFTTTALVYIPLWLNDRLFQVAQVTAPGEENDSSVEHLAIVPMVSFISSFVASLFVDRSHSLFDHKTLYLIGSFLCVGGCLLVEYSISVALSNFRLYSIAILFGAGSSITMISSLCLIANMIGKHADQSGFVYSAVTFADKLITGVAVLVIESL